MLMARILGVETDTSKIYSTKSANLPKCKIMCPVVPVEIKLGNLNVLLLIVLLILMPRIVG